ncbi:MAG: HAMP domain-containing histidine kinase [Flavobacteriales bacterium]|nr:HAMP domain-containing histidine kinase [Flavobacteriales bacterium]
MSYFISDEVDEKLRVDELRIIEHLKNSPEIVSIAPVIQVKEIYDESLINEGIKNVFIYDPIEKEDEPFRELTSVNRINGKKYLIKVRHSMIENEDLVFAISFAMMIILALVFTLIIVLNNRLSLKIWQPFYYNMDQLRRYSFTEKQELKFAISDVDEFEDLRNSLNTLTAKLQLDYRSLKEFTENASHEIQTPLSIISMNLDEVLQSEHSDGDYKKLYACYQSTQRLSKLNEKLLLLAKLDNNQFDDLEKHNFNDLLAEKLIEFKPFIDEKELDAVIVDNGDFVVLMDSLLVNLLLVNLLSNAVKHSIPKSSIEIVLSETSICISNKTRLKIDEKLIFKRFISGNDATNSAGLGLSIVKRITEVSSLEAKATATGEVFKICVSKK